MLFVCERCRSIDNTALGLWAGQLAKGLLVLCSVCAWGGKWHDFMPRRRYDRVVHGPMRPDRTLERGNVL